MGSKPRVLYAAVAAVLLVNATGCASLINNATSSFADDLSAAVMEQRDPELVRSGAPAFLLLLDSLVRRSPDNAEMLGAAAELYAAYGVAFVDDSKRARQLTDQARGYGTRALCIEAKKACALSGVDFDTYQSAIQSVDGKGADALFSYSLASLAYIRAHSSDWAALAELPKVEAALEHLRDISEPEDLGSIYLYLGVLNSLRPPALGGKPKVGRDYFEKAMELSGGKDLSVKVEYARGYARLVYDRELHDRLLNEVLVADVEQPGLTLFNIIAQDEARKLLASADDYF